MIYEVKILKKKESPFTGKDGKTVAYNWYNSEKVSDGLSIRFGSMNDGYEVGDVVKVDLLKEEILNLKGGSEFRYKEIING